MRLRFGSAELPTIAAAVGLDELEAARTASRTAAGRGEVEATPATPCATTEVDELEPVAAAEPGKPEAAPTAPRAAVEPDDEDEVAAALVVLGAFANAFFM